MGDGQVDKHTSDLRGQLRTDEVVDIVVDAQADKMLEIGIVLDAVWDEFLGLLLVLNLS